MSGILKALRGIFDGTKLQSAPQMVADKTVKAELHKIQDRMLKSAWCKELQNVSELNPEMFVRDRDNPSMD